MVGHQGREAAALSRSAIDRGLDLVTSVKDTAAEAMRQRRDPAVVAERRRVAARRRLVAWSLAAAVLLAAGASVATDIVSGDMAVTSVGAIVLIVGVLVYCVMGGVRSLSDLRTRGRIARALPPPGPSRRAVTGTIRPQIARLDAYSDALRQGVGMIGVDAAGRRVGAPHDAVHELRNETLAAADAAEYGLRAKAAQYTALTRGGDVSTLPEMADVRTRLEREIRDGVDEYGRLVAAASDVAEATRYLVGPASGSERAGLTDLTERLTALASGMREITGRPKTPGTGG